MLGTVGAAPSIFRPLYGACSGCGLDKLGPKTGMRPVSLGSLILYMSLAHNICRREQPVSRNP